MSHVFAADRVLHFGSLLLVAAWTVMAFVSLAAIGIREAQQVTHTLAQFVSWLMPVAGVYATWACLRMPYVVALTDANQLHFESLLGRRVLAGGEVSRLRRRGLGWFVVFETPREQVYMVSRIAGLPSLIALLREANPSLRVDDFS